MHACPILILYGFIQSCKNHLIPASCCPNPTPSLMHCRQFRAAQRCHSARAVGPETSSFIRSVLLFPNRCILLESFLRGFVHRSPLGLLASSIPGLEIVEEVFLPTFLSLLYQCCQTSFVISAFLALLALRVSPKQLFFDAQFLSQLHCFAFFILGFRHSPLLLGFRFLGVFFVRCNLSRSNRIVDDLTESLVVLQDVTAHDILVDFVHI